MARLGEGVTVFVWLQQATTWLAFAIDAVAVAIIAVAVLRGVAETASGALRSLRRPATAPAPAGDEPRLRLARALALALEFLLAADIMRTAVAPSWQEIGQLAAIAALRTALNFFIQREIDAAARAGVAAEARTSD